MSKSLLDDKECRSCEHFRWIYRVCILDRDEIHDAGYYCPEWQPIIITRKKPLHRDHP